MMNVQAIKMALSGGEASEQQEEKGDPRIMTKNGDAGRAICRGRIEIETRRMISCARFHGHPDVSACRRARIQSDQPSLNANTTVGSRKNGGLAFQTGLRGDGYDL
ncbi:hypothetical protein KM043_005742 [Ampulex compressa]|nr:hypothetical protein KM043_005742 [Ampulex compressa]